jgi:hypothetical protein
VSELPPPPPIWRRVLALPHALARELRWSLRTRLRLFVWRVRRGRQLRAPSSLRRAWARTDPHHLQRVVEGMRGGIRIHPPPPRPPAGAMAHFRGTLSSNGVRGDLYVDDIHLEDWLGRELGGDPGSGGVPVELSVRVLGDDDSVAGEPGALGQARPITAEEYSRLGEIGVIGEKVELIDGQILFGRYPLAFSAEQLAAAREAGIDLSAPEPYERGA